MTAMKVRKRKRIRIRMGKMAESVAFCAWRLGLLAATEGRPVERRMAGRHLAAWEGRQVWWWAMEAAAAVVRLG
jgi:hypothetical protein